MTVLAITLAALTATAMTTEQRVENPPNSPRFSPLPGRVVGLIITDPAERLAVEGRSGPPGAIAFARGNDSLRWVYLQRPDDPEADDLMFSVDPAGRVMKEFKKVRPATVELCKQGPLPTRLCLVELEVNGGAGSGPDEGFVATAVRVLDGTQDYPLKPAEVLTELQTRYTKHRTGQAKAIDTAFEAAFNDAKKKVGESRNPTGRREESSDITLTWDPDREVLRVTFTIRITDGFYIQAGGPPGGRPGRTGTQFGTVGGMTFEVGKSGKVEKETPRAFEPFVRELPKPQGTQPAPRGRPADRP